MSKSNCFCTLTRKKLKTIFFILVLILFLHIFGVFIHLFEKDFNTDFHYPYDGDIEEFVENLKINKTPFIAPINSYHFKYKHDCRHKCSNADQLRLVYIVKSAPENFDRRIGIRSTWGFERRFSDVEVRTIFLIGHRDSFTLQKNLEDEYGKFNDLVIGNFTDTYYNNTFKTMMGMEWIVKFCSNAKFYMFVDDDFYVSTKNVLRFVRYPTNYPRYIQEPMANVKKMLRGLKQVLDFELEDGIRLYTGYVFKSAPLRHYTSKWYVSLEEYPYHLWPPYVTAGSYILSRSAVIDMYYASFYTKHFRFDDIYLGLLAFKTKIEPFHCEEFHFHKKPYYLGNYEYTLASHGYENPDELLNIWTQQKSLGNA